MSKKLFLVEYLNDTNNVIKQPLLQTQRIKFTCFDVSKNYLVFGSTSGGIYIFNRTPCKFIKLVPSKEGCITKVLIAPNEQSIAASNVKGHVVVFKNCFSDNASVQIFTDHENKIITAINWSNGNELYVGDNSGQLSCISLLAEKFSKSLFHVPSVILMHLDSSIVQISSYSKYTLVSTKTRTFICNNETEQYWQVGKRLRDGEYGACFYVKEKETDVTNVISLRSSEYLLNNDKLPAEENVEDVKIYCAGPGSRIWEVKFDGSVLCTHQFKNSLNVEPSNLIHINNNPNVHLNETVIEGNDASDFNFERVTMLKEYVLSYNRNGIYIFNMYTIKLAYWTNYFNDIKELKVLNDKIYIWCGNFVLRTLALNDLETIFNRAIKHKQYILCDELITRYREQVLDVIKEGKLQRLILLEDKIKNSEIINEFKLIKEKLKTETEQKENDEQNEETENTESKKENENANKILYKVFLDNKTKTGDKDDNNEMIKTIGLSGFVKNYENFTNYLIDKDNTNQPILWYYNYILRYASSLELDELTASLNDKDVLRFLKTGLEMNYLNKNDEKHSCVCSFPLPTAKSQIFPYYTIGCEILDRLTREESRSLLTLIPRLHKYFIEKYSLNIPLLVQYSDLELFEKLCKRFTYNNWVECCDMLSKLRKMKCLNCDKDIIYNVSSAIDWNYLGKMMNISLGGATTLKLLTKYSNSMKPGELNQDFYQTILISSMMNLNVDQVKDLSNDSKGKPSKSMHMNALMENLLTMKAIGNSSSTNETSQNRSCAICDVLIKDDERFIVINCKHMCHLNCEDALKFCVQCLKRRKN